MRERVEDLGRIAEKIQEMLDRCIFTREAYCDESQDMCWEEEIRNQIELIRVDLLYLYDIARWGDEEFQPILREPYET